MPVCHVQVGGEDDAVELRHGLMTADIVVYDMFQHEQATKEALLFLLQQPVGAAPAMSTAACTPMRGTHTCMPWHGTARTHARTGRHAASSTSGAHMLIAPYCMHLQYGGREVVFVAVSTPLVWANTPPVFRLGTDDEEPAASNGKRAPFTQLEYSNR